MEIEEGIIEKTSKRKAFVRIQPSSACTTCKSRGTCDVSSDKRIVIEVANDLHAKIGDRVQISMPEGSLLKLSFLVYFLPVVALVAGAMLGDRLAPFLNMDPTPASVVSGASAMAIVFCALRWFDRGSNAREKYYPRMTRILFSAAPLSSCDDSR
ncbi:MAG: SoxR reducing system RseC family protein [Deltaproteobacteria bacterium]|nr:SoxR reducing system RseC family protein [Deltaproteobacteria bacterium]